MIDIRAVERMIDQIVGALSEECFNLKLNRIDLFYRSKLRDAGIHRKEELRNLWQKELSKFFEVFVSFILIHRRDYIMNNNNPLTEISLLVLSVAMLAAMTVLLVTGKITYVEALNFLIIVAGLFGVNVAAKAPSPAQQENLKQLTSQALSVLPTVVAATMQPAPTPPPTPVQLAPGALATTTAVQPQPEIK